MTMTSNAEEVAAALVAAFAGTRVKAQRVVTVYTAALETSTQAHESGRPGPKAPTGDYRRNTHRVPTIVTDRQIIGRVINPSDQAWRLEMGFVGADSLGRVYNQPPYPSFGPAFDEVAPLFATGCETLMAPE